MTKQAETFVVTSNSMLALFVRPEDRAYFSRPVRVVVNHTDENGLVWVTDEVRGQTYPVVKKDLRKSWAMTKAQLRSARA